MSIKRHFISQHHDGVLIEFDYKQLEIRVLALATGCKNLIEDLNNDVDMHRARAAEMYHIPEDDVTKPQRRKAKEFSFQLQYGASCESIAKYWNEPVPLVKRFFEAYFERYPEISEYHEQLMIFVKDNAVHDGDYEALDGSTLPVKRSIIPSIWDHTGATSGFFLKERVSEGWHSGGGGVPKRSTRTYFPPTKIKNYPIQGGAADILLLVLSRMRRILAKWEDSVHILLQVHDSILFDWYNPDKSRLGEFVREIKELMESVPEILAKVHCINSPIEFPVDVTIGKTWQDRKELDTSSLI